MNAIPGTVVSDAQLALRAQRGEIAAFETLIELYAPALSRMLGRVLADSTSAAEVTRETFVSAWQVLPGYRVDTPFIAWLCGIAMSEARRRLPDEAGWAEPPELADDADAHADRGREAANGEAARLSERLEALIARLPASYRAALVLRDVEGLSNEQAADVLGLEISLYKKRLHQARMWIASRLAVDIQTGTGAYAG